MRNPTLVTIAAGLVAFAAGIVLLFLPVTAYADSGLEVSCGRAAKTDLTEANREARGAELDGAVMGFESTAYDGYAKACMEDLDDRRFWAWGLVALGGVTAGIAWSVRRPEHADTE
jgi:hypothetical protein